MSRVGIEYDRNPGLKKKTAWQVCEVWPMLGRVYMASTMAML